MAILKLTHFDCTACISYSVSYETHLQLKESRNKNAIMFFLLCLY